MVLNHDPSVKRDNFFFKKCADKSHFVSLCSKLGSTGRKLLVAVVLHYVA